MQIGEITIGLDAPFQTLLVLREFCNDSTFEATSLSNRISDRSMKVITVKRRIIINLGVLVGWIILSR